MNTATDLYMDLLRAAVWGKEPHTEAMTPDTADEIIRLCHRHGTGPLVYDQLLRHPAWLSPDRAALCKQQCMQNMLLQARWEQLIEQVWQALDEGGVKATLMKGFAYAQRYPLPYLRQWGDLDVWVGVEQYHTACQLLRAAFPEAKHHDEEWDELKHYCLVMQDGMSIELHRVSMDFVSPREQTYWCNIEQEGMNHGATTRVGERDIATPEARFDLLFCFLHSWEHFCGTGTPLKQVADMALLMQQTGQTYTKAELETYLRPKLKTLHLLEAWRYYGYMVCRVMDMPMVEWPLLTSVGKNHPDRTTITYGERLLEQVMSEGQCREHHYLDNTTDRYASREAARRLPVWKRKLLTLRLRWKRAHWLAQFAPTYAWHTWWQNIGKGLRRTLRREAMINY